MTDARHEEFAESAAAYALGALDAPERIRFEAHLQTCDVCQKDVDAYRAVTAGLGGSVEPMATPAALKARVIAAATAGPRVRAVEPSATTANPLVLRPTTFPWLALAASLALAAAAGAYAWMLHAQLDTARRVAAETSARAETLRTQLSAARGDAVRSGRLLQVLTAPDVVRVSLAGTKPGSAARGQASWSPSRGLWFSADGLPVLSPGRIYQLWLVLPKQVPISAGLLAVDARGTGTLLAAGQSSGAISPPQAVTVAVTEEPASGSPGPTTPILLAGSAKTR
jgi:anti-sigma-K factor RskA